MAAILTSAYMPSVQWFYRLYRHGTARLEQWENYTKQTCRNRCQIDSPNGVLCLTVPVEGGGKCLMKDVRISDHNKWRHIHWEALRSSYLNSPFFEYYADDFRPFFEKKWDFLFDFNEEIVMKCAELMDLDIQLQRTECFVNDYSVDSMHTDYRENIPHASVDDGFAVCEYYQVFKNKHGFLPNISVVDLLFNMGPESVLVLDKCTDHIRQGKNLI